MTQSTPPIVTSFLLCYDATKTDRGFDLVGVSSVFHATMPGTVNLSGVIAITNIHKRQRLIVTFSDAATEFEGMKSAPLDIIAESPTGTLHLLSRFPNAEFPRYGDYIARLKTSDGDTLAQIKFQIAPPIADR